MQPYLTFSTMRGITNTNSIPKIWSYGSNVPKSNKGIIPSKSHLSLIPKCFIFLKEGHNSTISQLILHNQLINKISKPSHTCFINYETSLTGNNSLNIVFIGILPYYWYSKNQLSRLCSTSWKNAKIQQGKKFRQILWDFTPKLIRSSTFQP